jgi:hypothetical protein
MTPHPSTCQCGGSGFEKSSTDNSLKIPIPCTPSQEIVEWEKEAESIFHEIAIRGDASDEAYHIVIGKGLNFIRSLLASHSQALQEREVRCKACGSEEWQANIRDVDGEAEGAMACLNSEACTRFRFAVIPNTTTHPLIHHHFSEAVIY